MNKRTTEYEQNGHSFIHSFIHFHTRFFLGRVVGTAILRRLEKPRGFNNLR